MGLAPEYILIDQQKFSKTKLALDNHVYKNCEIDDCDVYYSGGQYTTHPQPPGQGHLQRHSDLQDEVPRFQHRLRIIRVSRKAWLMFLVTLGNLVPDKIRVTNNERCYLAIGTFSLNFAMGMD
jgi:hypothetical protein